MNKVITNIAILAITGTAAGMAWAQEDWVAISETQWEAEQASRALRQAELEEMMGTMAEEMKAIRATSNPEKRAELMASHRESMHQAMIMMSDMGGTFVHEMVSEHLGPAPAPASTADAPRHQHKRMPKSRPRAGMSDAERLADLETRLDMMQIMMESMLESQAQ